MDVLIVDDDRAVREALAKAIRQGGFGVMAVENGLSALAAIQRGPFDVIVCDIKMRFLDGVRLYHELEAEYPELRSRFFFISGVADDPAVEEAVRKTGRPLLRKPFDLQDFLKLVEDTATGEAPAADAYLPFSGAEAVALRAAGVRPGSTLVCPRCGGDLAIRSTASPDQSPAWELRCHHCRRYLKLRSNGRRAKHH
jgi:CheY-like chemotaxis protein